MKIYLLFHNNMFLNEALQYYFSGNSYFATGEGVVAFPYEIILQKTTQ